GTPRKDAAQKHVPNSSRGRQHSNQRKPKSDSEDTPQTPTKKPARSRKRQPKVELLTRDAPEGEQQSLLARFDGPPPARRIRQAATPPPAPSPSRRSKPAAAAGAPGVVYSPSPRRTHADHVAAVHGGSPKSAHYAGASFNNSPAANTLPLPPSFLTTPTKSPPPARNSIACDEDVFGMSPRRMTVGDRERQLESIIGPYRLPPPPQGESPAGLHHMLQAPMPMQLEFHGNHSAASLTPPDSGVASIFQKLRLAMDMPRQRPATVTPVSGAVPLPPPAYPHYAPAYHA
ncbi:hypothetical protein H4R19_002876, partial [Coemansia spiralis]